MLNKVLVFESDPAFAAELRSEFAHLGCTTTVVDDGNAGLQQALSDRPDLILLSIELPRVNGFSVCNKLKKDPSLKDVPLIIMSSESSDETFEQHKKLRTRAEDYVHKPIAFGELLDHIGRFVEVGHRIESRETDGSIVIEDEIEVGSSDYLLEDDAAIALEESVAAPGAPSLGPVDDDIDAFAESAFGRMTGSQPPPPMEADGANGANGVTAELPPPRISAAPPMETPPLRASMVPGATGRRSLSPTPPATSSLRPPPSGLDVLEHERVKSELATTRQRLQDAERSLDDAVREAGKLRLEVGDSAQLMREVDDLRAKLAAAPKPGGTSSRDFLDLREALNKKDKEILAFREQLSRKDRDIVEAQDRALGLERARADVEERLLALERELAEARDKGESIAEERDLARKASEDLRTRLDRTKADGDTKDRQIIELRAKQADERTANEAKLAAVRAEADQVIANERADNARALDQAEQRRGADLDQARREREAALSETRQQADREKQDALGGQFAQLRQEHDSAVAAMRRGHAQEQERLRSEALVHEQNALDGLRAVHEEAMRALAEERDARIVSLEAQGARERSEALDRIAQLDAELTAGRTEYQSLADAKRKDDAAYGAHITELDQRISTLDAARQDLQQNHDAATLRIATLVTELDESRRELDARAERLALLTASSGRARAKSDADRQSLERAKDALAMALAQIEETEVESPS
jgi:CheY-like chemotaxis protein